MVDIVFSAIGGFLSSSFYQYPMTTAATVGTFLGTCVFFVFQFKGDGNVPPTDVPATDNPLVFNLIPIDQMFKNVNEDSAAEDSAAEDSAENNVIPQTYGPNNISHPDNLFLPNLNGSPSFGYYMGGHFRYGRNRHELPALNDTILTLSKRLQNQHPSPQLQYTQENLGFPDRRIPEYIICRISGVPPPPEGNFMTLEEKCAWLMQNFSYNPDYKEILDEETFPSVRFVYQKNLQSLMRLMENPHFESKVVFNPSTSMDEIVETFTAVTPVNLINKPPAEAYDIIAFITSTSTAVTYPEQCVATRTRILEFFAVNYANKTGEPIVLNRHAVDFTRDLAMTVQDVPTQTLHVHGPLVEQLTKDEKALILQLRFLDLHKQVYMASQNPRPEDLLSNIPNRYEELLQVELYTGDPFDYLVSTVMLPFWIPGQVYVLLFALYQHRIFFPIYYLRFKICLKKFLSLEITMFLEKLNHFSKNTIASYEKQ